LAEQISFFEDELRIPLVPEPESSKLFPMSQRARDVRDALLARVERNGARVMFNTTVADISPASGRWRVGLDSGAPVLADAVIVATGGLSVPNTGSDGRGLAMLERLGHVMHPTYAALTPLTGSDVQFAALSGVSLPVTITARAADRSAVASGGFLFTHHGYSGPSVLDVSHVSVRSRQEPAAPARVSVRWTSLGETEWTAAFQPRGARTVLGAVRAALPDRLAATLVDMANVDAGRTLSDLRRDERLRLIDVLVNGTLPVSGDEGYKKAEVTGGGVSLAEVDARTMESRRHAGLFICGEALDAFGPIGGYNFFWAWATGRAAGIGAARPIE
ncbi:MAG: aminoacetone oxidase family FAD-binding enzyme, partial [Gemmatimonadaceae bacterium]